MQEIEKPDRLKRFLKTSVAELLIGEGETSLLDNHRRDIATLLCDILGVGIGVASGLATMGVVGFEGRYDYTANGNAVNLAARLCDHASDGQILISSRALAEVEESVRAIPVEELQLKGISSPVVSYNVVGLSEGDESTG